MFDSRLQRVHDFRRGLILIRTGSRIWAINMAAKIVWDLREERPTDSWGQGEALQEEARRAPALQKTERMGERNIKTDWAQRDRVAIAHGMVR